MTLQEELLEAVKQEVGGIYMVETLAPRCRQEDLDNALTMACYMGKISMVAVLIFHGANARYQDDLPLRSACRSSTSTVDVVEALLKFGCDPNTAEGSPLYYAASEGRIEMAEALLDAGAHHSFPGNPALVPACVKGHLPVVRLLIRAGASPEPGLQALADDATRRTFSNNGERLLTCNGLKVTGHQLATLYYLRGLSVPTLWDHLT